MFQVIKTNLITDMTDIGHVSMERKNDETQPLKPPNINGAKDNKGVSHMLYALVLIIIIIYRLYTAHIRVYGY